MHCCLLLRSKRVANRLENAVYVRVPVDEPADAVPEIQDAINPTYDQFKCGKAQRIVAIERKCSYLPSIDHFP